MPVLQWISVGAPRLLVSSWMSAADPGNVTPAAQLRWVAVGEKMFWQGTCSFTGSKDCHAAHVPLHVDNCLVCFFLCVFFFSISCFINTVSLVTYLRWQIIWAHCTQQVRRDPWASITQCCSRRRGEGRGGERRWWRWWTEVRSREWQSRGGETMKIGKQRR